MSVPMNRLDELTVTPPVSTPGKLTWVENGAPATGSLRTVLPLPEASQALNPVLCWPRKNRLPSMPKVCDGSNQPPAYRRMPPCAP